MGGTSGVGAIIRNDRGEVMAALSAKSPPVTGSKEAEIFACRRVVEFAVEMKGGGEEVMIIKYNFSRVGQQTLYDIAYQLGLYL